MNLKTSLLFIFALALAQLPLSGFTTAATTSNPINIENLVFKSTTGEASDSYAVGQQVLLSSTLHNTENQAFPYVGILDIRNEENLSVDIMSSEGDIGAQQTLTFQLGWKAGQVGKYTVKELIISSLDNPEILSSDFSKTFNISKEPSPIQEEPTTPHAQPVPPKVSRSELANYTILVYMVPSDLESGGYYATQDIQEMMAVGSNPNVNVIIETGGSANSTIDGTRFIDFTKVQRHIVEKEKVQTLQDLGKQNMAISQTLSDFLRWGTKEYPANKYVVILWDHGAGLLGFGLDDIYNDTLTMDEIRDSFLSIAGADRKIELIGFDACLMASIEVSNQLSTVANFLVASEEVEPAWGWDYSAILKSLQQDPTLDGKELGRVIADSYMDQTQKISETYADFGSDQIITMSVIDLSKIGELVNQVDKLGDSFAEHFGDQHTTYSITKSVRMTERYGDAGRDSSGHVDLYHLATNIEQAFPEDKGITEQIRSAVIQAVAYHVSGQARPDSHGISMYLQVQENKSDAPYLRQIIGSWVAVFDFGRKVLENDNFAPQISLRMDRSAQQSISGEIKGEDTATISYYFTQKVPENRLKIRIASIVDMDALEFKENDKFSRDINFTWDERLASLCNSNQQDCQPTSIWYEKNGKISAAFIPARLESPHYNGSLTLIYLVRPDGIFDFIGGWPGLDEHGNAQRDLVPLVKGDRVYTTSYELVYQPAEDVTRLDTIESENPIVVSDDFGPAYHRFPGDYDLVVSACDYSYNCSYSNEFQFRVEEE